MKFHINIINHHLFFVIFLIKKQSFSLCFLLDCKYFWYRSEQKLMIGIIKIKMSDVFDTCETNFLKNIRFVQKSLQQTKDSSKLPELNEALSEATQEINRMEIECGICQQGDMRAKINLYKDQLRSYKRKVSQRERVASEEQKHHLSDQIFEKDEEAGADPLLQAKRQMYEAEAMSNEAAVGIKKNNQKLMKNITRMGDINNELTKAQKLLGSIKQKLNKNKYTLWATIFILLLVVVFVIYTYVG